MTESFVLKKFNINELNAKPDKKVLIEMGKERAKLVPVEELTSYHTVKRDAVKMIEAQEATRIQSLLPLRHKRMMKNAFTFLRGTVGIMDYDIINGCKQTKIPVMICGDAHLNNFGFFASPERQLLFGVNDFDETQVGDWTIDLRRLLVSAKLIGDINGYSQKDTYKILKKTAKSYEKGIEYANSLNLLKRHYRAYNIKDLLKMIKKHDKQMEKVLKKIAKKAPKNNSNQVVRKHAHLVDGKLKFIENPPRAKHLSKQRYETLVKAMKKYQNNLNPDMQVFLSNFKIDDIIRYSVGVGSFGTRCYLVLLEGKDGTNLVLQIKEASPTPYELISGVEVTKKQETEEGRRVITGQKILQTFYDIFIGPTDTTKRSYYVRQFRDMKDSIDCLKLDRHSFTAYASLCSFILAMAHYQSPTAPLIYGYLKAGKKFSKGMANWAEQYSQQVYQDYKDFSKHLYGKE